MCVYKFRYYRIKPSESNPTQLLAPVGYSADEPLIGQESKILRSTDGWEMYSGEELVGTKSVPNVMEKDQFGLFEKVINWK